jgi:phosphonopyruvate decarboxylase
MITCKDFFELCKKCDFTFFAGVPDSTFKSWMSFLEKNKGSLTNIPTVNECEAVAVCTGYHLATGKIGVLYMQNSGFGKTVNPLTSICDPEVYSIPILLMIGWRGEPGTKDAYQHHKMGPMTIPLLEILEIPYEIISDDIKKLNKTLKKAKEFMEKENKSFALVVKKGIFEKLKDIKETKEQKSHDFYNIGAMGCAQSIALGIAINKKDNKVFVLDGDGSVLMQMGALATTGSKSPKNFYHIVFDNQAHDSTGGQPTVSDIVDFDKVALACNYKSAKLVDNINSLKNEVKKIKEKPGPSLLVIKVKKGAREDLSRPSLPPKEHKEKFMKYMREA